MKKTNPNKGMLKTLAKSIREYMRPSILSPICIAVEVIMEVLIPTAMAMLIDEGINKGDMGSIGTIGCVLIIFCLISLAGGVLSAKYGAEASCGFGKNLRHDLFYRAQKFSFSNIDKFSTASLVTRMTTDVNNVQNAYQMIIRIAVRSPLMFVFSLIMAFRINAGLSLLFLVFMPILAIGLAIIMNKAHPLFKRTFKEYDKLNNVVGENLHGIRVVKSFVREEHETEKFTNTSEGIYKGFSKAQKLLAVNAPLMQFCMYSCTLLISWFGAQLIVNSGGTDFSVGQLQSLITYTAQILMSLMMLSMIFVGLTLARTSAERIYEVLREQSDIENPENPVMQVENGKITFEDVVFTYAKNGGKNCLSDINIEIESGETIGIIGATGSAKSTFVQLIPRLYDVKSGRVTVGGVDVRDYDIKTLRDSVAMVLQKNELFSGTIKDNLRWGNENATDEEMIHACKLSRADEFICTLPNGYDTYIEQGGTNVSGGQKQRICIARALLKKPKILILDDSTSAVDTKTDSLIQEAFRKEIPNTTKIIIAQRISSVEKADKIIVLEDGTVNGFGTHEELLRTNEIYSEVYKSQIKGSDEKGDEENNG